MRSEFRVGFCVSGGGHLCRAAVVHSTSLGIEPAFVLLGSRAAGDLEGFCRGYGVEVVRLPTGLSKDEFSQAMTSECTRAGLDLLCLTFDRILPPQLVDHYRGRTVNVHMGLLPAFKGLNALEMAILRGVRFAGATIHGVDDEVDQGPVIAQCVVGVLPEDTVLSLGGRVFDLLRPMYLQVIAWYAAGRISRDDAGGLWVRGGVYGRLPTSPSIEEKFILALDPDRKGRTG